jgi:uncharacterized protein involved in exopolysaccharide biosynthesis
MQEKSAYSLSLRELLVFFYKYRRRLILAFLVPFVFSVAVSFLPSPRFIANSVLIVRLGSEYVYQPEISSSKTNPEIPIPYQQDQIFKSEAAILASKDLHQQVVESIGVDVLYPPQTLMQSVKAPLKKLLISAGLKEQLSDEEMYKRKLAGAVALFDKRFDVVLEKESAVINVSLQHENAEMAANSLDTLLRMYMEKRKQLYIEPRLKLAQGQASAAQKKALSAAKAVDDFKRTHQLHSLEAQRASLLASKNDVEKQRINLDSPVLDQTAAHYSRQLAELDKQESKYATLTHEAQIANEEYALAVHNVSEAKAFDELARERIGSVRIIQNATVSPYPVQIQPLIILAGVFLSILSIFFVAAVTEVGRSGFLTPEEAERTLGLPVLAVLSRHKDRK